MARLLRLAALVLLLALPANAQDKKEVDLALAMAIDISGSIDPDEAKLQREGYVMAFRDPVIVKAILGGANGRIAVAYYEWSDAWVQRLLIDWTLLDSEASIAAFANRLANVPISISRRTSISGAIRYAIPLFGRSPYEAGRKVLDISGDGSNNDGGLVTDQRHEALKERIVINGLPIMNDRPNPRHRRAALVRRGRAQFRGFPPRCAQEAVAGSRRPRPAPRFRCRRARRPARRHAARAKRRQPSYGARRGRLYQVRPAGIRARLRCRRAAIARVLAAPLRGHAGLTDLAYPIG